MREFYPVGYPQWVPWQAGTAVKLTGLLQPWVRGRMVFSLGGLEGQVAYMVYVRLSLSRKSFSREDCGVCEADFVYTVKVAEVVTEIE